MTVYVLADDLTGANDTAVQFAMRGMRAATILGPDSEAGFLELRGLGLCHGEQGCDRRGGVSPPPCLVGQGGGRIRTNLVYKKVDSALRGNLGAEIRAVLDGFSAARAVLLAPALPANGRTTVGGRQLLGGVPVHETEMAEGSPSRRSGSLTCRRSCHGRA